MSTPVLGAGATAGPGGVLAASERMQRLQSLIAQVEDGPAGFAAALDAAQASTATATSAGAGAATQSQTSSTAAYPATASPTSLGLDAPDAASASAYDGIDAGADQAPAAYPAVYQSPSGSSLPTTTDAAQTTSSGSPSGQYTALIEQAAARNGVDPAVLYGLIEQESDFNPSAASGAGALGLTQLMPGTAASLGVTEPLNPAQSIEGGARYLGQMLRQFSGNTAEALAAYNAGPGAVQQYGGVPPYTETQQYVSKVLANAAAYRASTGAQEPVSAVPATVTAAAQTAAPALTGATAATAETIA